MKFRTKLYLALVFTTLLSVIVCLGITYFQARKIVLNELRTDVMSIAADSAASINSTDLKIIKNDRTNDSAAYNRVQQQLRQIRDINRRDDVYVKFVYIITPLAGASDKYEYLVDAEEKNSADFSDLGESAEEAETTHLDQHTAGVYAPLGFVHDSWGVWLTAYAPIKDSSGIYLGSIGVNLYASAVLGKLNQLIEYGVISFLAAVILALLLGWYLARRQSLALEVLHQGVTAIGAGKLETRVTLTSHDEFAELADEVNKMATGLQQRERLQQNFARYVSQHVMESILTTGNDVSLSGEQRKVTLLFSDIRNFTHISEQYRPDQVVRYLNEYFSTMVEIIFRNNGSLDKFIGDGIMVEFGVPLEDENQELNAVKTAIEMVKGVEDLRAKWKSEGKNIPLIEIGVGIHTGIAVIGNIGSEKRYEYTAIGDVVNSASRIEQLTKELKTPILFSEETALALRDKLAVKFMGEQEIRGKKGKINIYTIADELR